MFNQMPQHRKFGYDIIKYRNHEKKTTGQNRVIIRHNAHNKRPQCGPGDAGV